VDFSSCKANFRRFADTRQENITQQGEKSAKKQGFYLVSTLANVFGSFLFLPSALLEKIHAERSADGQDKQE